MALKSTDRRSREHADALRLNRRPFVLICLFAPLVAALYGFVQQQSSTPFWPAEPREALVRGEIVASNGLILAEGPVEARRYPQGSLAAHIVGFSGARQDDGRYGLEGIELVMDARLQAGERIVLTIDPQLQSIAESKLANTIAAFEAENGAVVMIEAGTGRILAAASYPTYDPNFQASVSDRTAIVNKAFMHRFEPGSVMKTFVIAALLESGRLHASEIIEAPMTLRVGNNTFRDVAQHDPELSVWDILRYSSNSGMINMGRRFSDDELRAWLYHFGFGQDVGTPSIYSRPGLLRQTPWVPQDQASIIIGQSMSTTALQLAALYSIFANDGYFITPYLVEGDVTPAPREVISVETARLMRAMMQYTVEKSNIRHAMTAGVSVAGKTGTADIFDPNQGMYVKGDYTLTFAGMVPADEPKYTLVVTLQKPNMDSSTYVAAPLFGDITSEATALWQLPGQPPALATSP
jgi:cell division protein FtsI (penicillin-binding protein 3)